MKQRVYPTLPSASPDVRQAITLAYDYIFQLEAHVEKSLAEIAPSSGSVVQDTHANRVLYPAADYPLGSLYIETDRNDVVYINQTTSGANAWVYLSGILRGAYATISTLGLGSNDAGFLFHSTDYLHAHRWTGTVWQFAPGDPGSRFIVLSENAPLGGYWQVCDGTTVAVATSAGATQNVATPNFATDANGDSVFLMAGSAYTGATPLIRARANWAAANDTGTPSATTTFMEGAGSDVTVASDTHSHKLTDGVVDLVFPGETTSPAAGPSGLPRRMGLIAFMRR